MVIGINTNSAVLVSPIIRIPPLECLIITGLFPFIILVKLYGTHYVQIEGRTFTRIQRFSLSLMDRRKFNLHCEFFLSVYKVQVALMIIDCILDDLGTEAFVIFTFCRMSIALIKLIQNVDRD